MSSPEIIVCTPTPWFRYRAAAIFIMFAVFAVLFYIDGSSGYRKKNQVFYLYQCFEKAGQEFSSMNAEGALTAEEWKRHAEGMHVDFPADESLLPKGTRLPMPWPAILHDFERMKSLQWNQLWLDYSEQEGLDSTPPEQPYDSRKFKEQWVFFYICGTLALVSLFFLVRTSRRRMTADDEAITAPNGRRVPYSAFHRLDLRNWDRKGIASAEYDGPDGKGRIRIDGLTYGGFKKERGEPAEKLMQRLRSNFTGELLEYSAVEDSAGPEPADEAAPEGSGEDAGAR